MRLLEDLAHKNLRRQRRSSEFSVLGGHLQGRTCGNAMSLGSDEARYEIIWDEPIVGNRLAATRLVSRRAAAQRWTLRRKGSKWPVTVVAMTNAEDVESLWSYYFLCSGYQGNV